ncbi:MAG TPA: penicillin-insensitive murein endopeptidase [Polyangiaceae bacterium]|nr:penicillin-insensitive murein endopeptidase [Polyangiaceae bacterium]
MKRVFAAALALAAASCGILREESRPASAPVSLQHAYQGKPLAALPARPEPQVEEQRSVPPEAEPAYEQESEGAIADDFETDEGAPSEGSVRPHPLDDVSQREIEERLATDPSLLGSISMGAPSGGRLFNGVQMPADDRRWELVDPAHAWGTRETVDYLMLAIGKVHEQFPSSPKLYIGHISGKEGGHLSPHLSHQAGRDVDISYFYTNERAGWYARAGAHNLDLPRTWAFVRALITETDVELILIDHSLQALLRKHALQIGENEAWVSELFRGRAKLRPLIVHAKGHATHVHVRFYNPIAQETARRLYTSLVQRGLVRPPTYYVSHKVRKGETLGMLSRKYGVDVQSIKKSNGLRRSLIRAGHVYKIPKSGGVRAAPARVAIPARRLPPRAPRFAPAPAAAELTPRSGRPL